MLLGKYLKTTKWVKNARSDEDRQRFLSMVELFKKYANEYGFDYLLIAAQASTSRRRPDEGAADPRPRCHAAPAHQRRALNIPHIEKLESNIKAGIKYNRWMIDTYYSERGPHPSIGAFSLSRRTTRVQPRSRPAPEGGRRKASIPTSGSTTWS